MLSMGWECGRGEVGGVQLWRPASIQATQLMTTRACTSKLAHHACALRTHTKEITVPLGMRPGTLKTRPMALFELAVRSSGPER